MQELGSGPKEPPKKRNTASGSGSQTPSTDNGESSSTSAPPLPQIEEIRVKYPPIPLSRILHPSSDVPLYWKYPKLHGRQNINSPVSSTPPGFVVKNEDDEEEEDSTPPTQNLRFMDPGNQETMLARVAAGNANPRAIGGILDMLNSFNSFPVTTTLRNAELFTFCGLTFACMKLQEHLY